MSDDTLTDAPKGDILLADRIKRVNRHTEEAVFYCGMGEYDLAIYELKQAQGKLDQAFTYAKEQRDKND
jgi:Holliday junction resolvasome RuvABC ATP-dependent DNA helicase subunit